MRNILQKTLLGDFIEHNYNLIYVFIGSYPGIGISIKVSADGNIVTCASEFTRIGSTTEYSSGDNNCTSIVSFTNDLFKPNVGNILKNIDIVQLLIFYYYYFLSKKLYFSA